jgi:hypothetical protein
MIAWEFIAICGYLAAATCSIVPAVAADKAPVLLRQNVYELHFYYVFDTITTQLYNYIKWLMQHACAR